MTQKSIEIPRGANAAAMRGNKVPRVHRLFLSDGRVLRGELHRSPSLRLADHLSGSKGFISVTNARCERTAELLPHVAVNMSNVLFIQELRPGASDI